MPLNIFPENVSTYGQEIDTLFYITCALTGFAFIVTLIFMIYPLFAYHWKRKIAPRYIKGNTWKQLSFVIVCMVILAISDFYLLFKEHSTWVKIEETVPEADVRIGIIGRQWNWIFV